MPFPDQAPREFTRVKIEALNKNQMGVCGLFKQGRWIYIGSGDIRQWLLDHFNGDNGCITREGATHWVDVLTSNFVEREKELIIELNPSCNERVG